MEILEHLKKLEAEATPGKWHFIQDEENVYDWEVWNHPDPFGDGNEPDTHMIMQNEVFVTERWEKEKADAKLIVAMRNCIPLLIELAEAVDNVLNEPHGIGRAVKQHRLVTTYLKLKELKPNL